MSERQFWKTMVIVSSIATALVTILFVLQTLALFGKAQ